VQAVTVAEVADELYGLPPADFTAARDERARAARTAGRRDDAAEIRKLPRPTTSAWLVNQLSREAPEALGRLFDVAGALQEAQRSLAGDRLRELSGKRRQVVADLLPVAEAVAGRAGQPASPAVLEEVRATLEAALADADAREAVRSGRLTRALAYAGLGEVDLAMAAALLPAGPPQRRVARPGRAARLPRSGRAAAEPGMAQSAAPAGSEPAGSAPAGSAPAGSAPAGRAPAGRGSGARPAPAGTTAGPAAPDRAAPAAETLAAAESAAASAARAVSVAERELAAISEQRQFLRRRISHLEGELAHAREEDARLATDTQGAERSRDAAARDLRAAERRLGRARREQPRPRTPGKG
jgi:hypothetical protein